MIDAADLREIIGAVAMALAFLLVIGIVAHCSMPKGSK